MAVFIQSIRRRRTSARRRLFLEPLEDRCLLAQVNAVWVGGSGNWNVASNWSPAVVPNNGSPVGTTYAVFIDNGTTGTNSSVNLDISATIDSLAIDSGDRLSLPDNRSLTVVNTGAGTGTINNAGTIALVTGGNPTELKISGNVTLTGGGTVELSDNGALSNRIVGTAGTDRLTNVNNTISGSGRIGNDSMALTNQGTIIANVSNKLILDPSLDSDITNAGTLRASNGGVLQLDVGAYLNTSGTIEALANSRVDLNGANVSGGTMQTTGSGNVRTVSGPADAVSGLTTLNTLTNAGNFEVIHNTAVILVGTITNTGIIAITTGGFNSDLKISGNVTLTGSGTVTMSDNGQLTNRIIGTAATDRLTNVNNTISGSGRIGDNMMALTNQGTIIANVTSRLILDPSPTGDFTNSGTLRASNGGVLQLDAGSYLNTGGKIEAVIGSRVELNGTNITGGTLQTSGTGNIRTISGPANLASGLTTLNSLTNAGNFEVIHNSAAVLVGTINNTGNIALNTGGFNTDLKISGEVTLTGGGTVMMSDNGALTNRIIGTATTDRLINVDNTISGSGRIGDNSLLLTNEGTIVANVSSNLIINPSGDAQSATPGMENTGTLKAEPGSTLVLEDGRFSQSETGAIAGGGTVSLKNSSLDGTGTVGNYTQDASAVLIISLNGTAPGEFDQLTVTGSVSLSGSLNTLFGFTPATGATFKIIDNKGSNPVNGTFAGLPEGATFQSGGNTVRINYAAGDGNDVVLTVTVGTSCTFVVTNTLDSGFGSLRDAIICANNTPNIDRDGLPGVDPDPISFAIPHAPTDATSWWKAEGNANDSADGNHGTLQGDVTFVPGKVGQAFSFDGNGDAINIPRTPNLELGTGNFTLDAWVRFNSGSGTRIIFENYGGNPMYRLAINAANHAVFFFRDQQGDDVNVVGASALNDGAWHHIAGVREGTTGRLYVDGILQNTDTDPLVESVTTGQLGAFARIGGTNTEVSTSPTAIEAFFTGLIDELDVFPRALSAAEVSSIFQADSAGKGITVKTIRPTTPLPAITDAVIIDGYTQPGAKPNTNDPTNGSNAVLLIELNGTNENGNRGLDITAGNSTVKGLVMNGWIGQAILVREKGGNVISGNVLGTDPFTPSVLPNRNAIVLDATNPGGNTIGGLTPADRNIIVGNTNRGIISDNDGTAGNIIVGNFFTSNSVAYETASSGDRVGGTTLAERNLIVANTAAGLIVETGSANVTIQGNYIGTDLFGTGAIGNGHLSGGGGIISRGTKITIGGTVPGAGNLISGNFGNGITIDGDDVTIQGNTIGTDVSGTKALANGDGILASGTNITIGGTAENAGNLISGNIVAAIRLEGSNHLVQGNLIGVNRTGTAKLANGGGIVVGGNNITIGGTTAAARNIISGNESDGVTIGEGGLNRILGNYIGTDITGSIVDPDGVPGSGDELGNGLGIQVFDSNNTIGGTTPGAGNIIAGTVFGGISILSDNNIVQGNYVGTNPSGARLGNGGGIGILGGSDNIIGGTVAEARNVIAFNLGNGVDVITLETGPAVGNSVLGNSIFSNVGLGIDLGEDGSTANDTNDSDTGPNNLQNFPVLNAPRLLSDGRLSVAYNVPSDPANSAYPLRVQFFLADSDGQEGQTFLGDDLYEATEFGTTPRIVFTPLAAVPPGAKIVATASDNFGIDNTSEFSPGVRLASPWHNSAEPMDVRGGSVVVPDGHIDAGDALAIINYINAFDPEIPDDAEVGLPFGFLDVTNDYSVAPDDALTIINAINAGLGGEPESGPTVPAGQAQPAETSVSNDLNSLIALLALDTASQSTRRRK